MADIADLAEHQEELLRQAALAHRKPTVTPRGTCHNCDEPLADGLLFCDADCRADYDHRTTRQQQNK